MEYCIVFVQIYLHFPDCKQKESFFHREYPCQVLKKLCNGLGGAREKTLLFVRTQHPMCVAARHLTPGQLTPDN